MSYVIQTHGIGAVAHQKPLIKEVSVNIDRGGIHMILGANGAGKSSLLRCLHGLTPITSGSITPPPNTIKQGMVFQKPVFLNASVQANLLIAVPKTNKEPDGSIANVLKQVGLHHRQKQMARTLSGGEQQKLALARALLTQPELLLLDEPTANLDVHAAPEFETLLMSVAEQGCTLLMTSHSIRQAKRLADTVIFMHDGQVLEHTHATHFFNEPQSLHAQRFLLLAD